MNFCTFSKKKLILNFEMLIRFSNEIDTKKAILPQEIGFPNLVTANWYFDKSQLKKYSQI